MLIIFILCIKQRSPGTSGTAAAPPPEGIEQQFFIFSYIFHRYNLKKDISLTSQTMGFGRMFGEQGLEAAASALRG